MHSHLLFPTMNNRCWNQSSFTTFLFLFLCFACCLIVKKKFFFPSVDHFHEKWKEKFHIRSQMRLTSEDCSFCFSPSIERKKTGLPMWNEWINEKFHSNTFQLFIWKQFTYLLDKHEREREREKIPFHSCISCLHLAIHSLPGDFNSSRDWINVFDWR